MNPYAALASQDREILTRTADTIAILRVDGCRDLSVRLLSLACPDRTDQASVPNTVALASRVRRNLLAQACPDFWADDIADLRLPDADAADLAAGLVEERTRQAAAVQTATDILLHMRHAPVAVG